MKRKFAAKQCVLCLHGEDCIIVNESEFSMMQACLETKQNLALCLVEHENKHQDTY
jgi:hypothetical protein